METHEPLRLTCVTAHPDDESFGMGGTLARYAAEGAEVHVVCATRGEANGGRGIETDLFAGLRYHAAAPAAVAGLHPGIAATGGTADGDLGTH